MSTSPPDPPALPGLAKYRVPNLPPACYYIPDFITAEEEAYLLRKVDETPQPKWKKVGSGRRLCYWGGTMSKNSVLLPEPLPEWLSSFPDIIDRIDAFLDAATSDGGSENKGKDKVLGINQVLVNEYLPGQGISPHEDGLAFRPLVATLSLGSPTILDLHHYVSPTAPSPPMIAAEEDSGDGPRAIAAVPLGHVLLMPRSLFVLTGSLYTSHLHGITARDRDSFIAPERPLASTAGDLAAAPGGAGAAPGTERGDDGGVPDPVKTGATDTAPSDTNAPPATPDQTAASTASTETTTTGQPTPAPSTTKATVVANASLLGLDALPREPFTYERGTRVSLTFRHANKVLKGGAFAMAAGGLRRH